MVYKSIGSLLFVFGDMIGESLPLFFPFRQCNANLHGLLKSSKSPVFPSLCKLNCIMFYGVIFEVYNFNMGGTPENYGWLEWVKVPNPYMAEDGEPTPVLD